jgi:nitrogen permease regulator 3-like protein
MVMSCVNSDNLLGVALVINRSRDGPAFVFHYPEHVQPIAVGAGQQSSVDLEDILLERLAQPASRNAFGGSDGEQAPRAWNHDEHVITEAGSHVVPWDIVAGFPARDLASVLTPARAYHKTLFQLSLDPLYCVSYPIHVPENGKWKKSKKASRADTARSTDEHVAANDSDGNTNRPQKLNQDKDGKKNDGGDDDSKRSSMTMFNLVFLLNPKKFEVKELVDSLYVNFVKKANKAYKYSQQRSDFVWKESKRILAAKDKGREDRE